jgi:Uma2 family endonuclease
MNKPVKDNQDLDYEVYSKSDDIKRYEILKGKRTMVPAPSEAHQRVSRNTEFLILQYLEGQSLGEVYNAPFDVVLDQNNVVQPDIIFIKRENVNIIKKKGIFGSPDLIVEIISPLSKVRDTYEKKEQYENFKVSEYWIIDPANNTIEIFHLNKNEQYQLISNGFYEEDNLLSQNKSLKSKILEGLEIRLDKIFKKVTR